ADALQISEQARARSLLELLAEAKVNIRQGIDAQLAARERSLQQELNAKAERLIILKNSKHTEQQVEAAEKELNELTAKFENLQVEIRATSPRYAALTQPQPLDLKKA